MQNIRTDARPRLPLGASLLLTLSLMFFMSFSVCTEVKLCRYMVVLVFALLLFIAVRSRLVIALAALPCLLAFLGAETSASMPLLLCIVAIVGFGGFALHAVHPLVLSAAPICAYLLAFALTGNFMESLSVLSFVPLAVIAALTLHFKLSRTASVAVVSASLLVYAALALLVALPEGISLSAEAFSEFIVSFRELLTDEIMNMAEAEELSAVFGTVTKDAVSTLINAFLRLLPAILIVTAEIIAYLSCLIAVSLRVSQFPEHPLPIKCAAFRMSAVSAALFLISFVLSLFPEGRSDAIGILLVTAMNLFVILLPGLAVCGALHLLASFRQKRFLSPILLIVLLLWFSSFVLIILAFIGAFTVLRTEKTAKHNQKGQN